MSPNHPTVAFAPGRPGPRIFRGPAKIPRPAPHHRAKRGGAGHLFDRAGRGGASFLAPRLIPRSGAPLFTGPRPVHRLYSFAGRDIFCRSRLFFSVISRNSGALVFDKGEKRSISPYRTPGYRLFVEKPKKKGATGKKMSRPAINRRDIS